MPKTTNTQADWEKDFLTDFTEHGKSVHEDWNINGVPELVVERIRSLITQTEKKAREEEGERLLPILDTNIISRIGNDVLRNKLRHELIKSLSNTTKEEK